MACLNMQGDVGRGIVACLNMQGDVGRGEGFEEFITYH